MSSDVAGELGGRLLERVADRLQDLPNRVGDSGADFLASKLDGGGQPRDEVPAADFGGLLGLEWHRRAGWFPIEELALGDIRGVPHLLGDEAARARLTLHGCEQCFGGGPVACRHNVELAACSLNSCTACTAPKLIVWRLIWSFMRAATLPGGTH